MKIPNIILEAFSKTQRHCHCEAPFAEAISPSKKNEIASLRNARNDRVKVFLRSLLILLIITLAACTNDNGEIGNYRYRTDMHTQPSFKKLEDPLPPVKNTVPVSGIEAPLRDSASAARLLNPVRWTPENADSGKFLYETHCSPCHGLGAKGDGLVAAKFQQPPDLTLERYKRIPDGYVYYVIRNGKLIMPSYYESVKSHERWLIVNHLRTLQK